MLNTDSINNFVKEWYKKLDVHAPMVEVLPMLSKENLVLVFPEVTDYGLEGFERWYQRVIRIFFDEIHTVKEVKSTILSHSAQVKVVVQWEASVWNAPEANSKRIKLDAFQTWEVQIQNESIVITKYVVDEIKYHENSAQL
jgi:hypothetical protein